MERSDRPRDPSSGEAVQAAHVDIDRILARERRKGWPRYYPEPHRREPSAGERRASNRVLAGVAVWTIALWGASVNGYHKEFIAAVVLAIILGWTALYLYEQIRFGATRRDVATRLLNVTGWIALYVGGLFLLIWTTMPVFSLANSLGISIWLQLLFVPIAIMGAGTLVGKTYSAISRLLFNRR